MVIGHGLAGCILAMTLYRKKIQFSQFGATLPGESSMASSGLINPITGRRYVKAWDIDVYIDHALDFFRWSESILGKRFFEPVEIIRFLSNEEARLAWLGRLRDPEYRKYISDKVYKELDELGRPYGIVTGGYRLDTPAWIIAVRSFLVEKQILAISSAITLPDHADNVQSILATGAIDPIGSHGIIANKGEALIVRMPEWKIPLIMKDEIYVVPLYEDLYWIGSYYQPLPDDPLPSNEGKEKLMNSLKKLHKGPIHILEHLAGVRPTVNDRRPVIGQHPANSNWYLFNGMGTKTTSLGPYWAEQLIRHLQEGVSLPKDVSPDRY